MHYLLNSYIFQTKNQKMILSYKSAGLSGIVNLKSLLSDQNSLKSWSHLCVDRKPGRSCRGDKGKPNILTLNMMAD